MHANLRELARGRWPGILAALGMDERLLSGRHGPCPACGGKDRFRFDNKDGRGTFYCSGCGAGDGVELAMRLSGQDFQATAHQIERLVSGVPQVAARFVRSDAEKLAVLRRVWKESRPLQRGDETERYLRGRGLELYDLPPALRTHSGIRYRDDAVDAVFPCMLATVTGPEGRALSLHRTWLHDCKKAPVASPKRLMPGLGIAGAAIRLTQVSQTLGIAEGIETAIAAFELFEVPVWSCISAGGIESFEPPSETKHVIVFADNDENFVGQAAAYKCAHRLAGKGLDVEVCIPAEPGDWLDALVARRENR